MTKPEILYHYCSVDAFKSIISNREIWLTDLSASNDHQEGLWISQVLKYYLENYPPKEFASDFVQDSIGRMDDLFETLRYDHNCFALCLSEKGDLLSQWRGYADDGMGFAIGFNRETLEDNLIHPFEHVGWVALQKVLYGYNESELLAANYIEPQIQRGNMGVAWARSMAYHAYRTKSPAFEEENEWRLASVLPDYDIDSEHQENYRKLQFRGRRNQLVPYIPISIDLESEVISEVIIGPKNLSDEQAIKWFLKSHGFESEIHRSVASYR